MYSGYQKDEVRCWALALLLPHTKYEFETSFIPKSAQADKNLLKIGLNRRFIFELRAV
jgi:hypothetical protein